MRAKAHAPFASLRAQAGRAQRVRFAANATVRRVEDKKRARAWGRGGAARVSARVCKEEKAQRTTAPC
jgi:hypothetical protein